MDNWNYENDLVVRKPSNEEQFLAKIDTSDYQISGLTIQSKILHTFGLCSKIYRSKFTTVQYSTKKMVSRYEAVFNKTFALFEKTDPTDKLYDSKDFTLTNLNERFGINIRTLLINYAKWSDVLKQDVLLPLIVAFVKGKNNDLTEDENYEPSDEMVEECKVLYVRVSEFFEEQKNNGLTLKRFVTRIGILDSFFSLIEDDFFKGIHDEILDFKGTIGQLSRFIDSYLNKQNKGSIRGYARTIMENEVLDAQKKISDTLKKEGLKFNFDGFKYWLNVYAPEIELAIKEEYNLVLSERPEIKDFEDLAKWFYEPDRMHAIRESLGVRVRSRVKGEPRQGVKWVIKSFNYDSKIKTLSDRIGDFNEVEASQRVRDLSKKLEQREQENREAKMARHRANVNLKNAKKTKDEALIEKYQKEYEEMVEAANTISKLLTATKKAFIKAKNDIDKKTTAVEKVKEYREKYGDLISSMKKTATNEDKDLVNDLEKKMKLRIIEEDTIPYSTWTFKAYVINEDVIRVVTDELESAFSVIKGKNGSSSYINVTSYAYLDSEKNAISEFYVDYPKGNKLYKAFEKNPNLSSVLIEGIAKMVKEKLGYYVDFAPEEAKWNVDMEKTLENGDDPLDAWDF